MAQSAELQSAAASKGAEPWGRWATLGLGTVALLAGQGAALTALILWTGQGLAHWVNMASDGAAVALVVSISTPVQVLLLILMSRRGGGAVEYLGLKLPRKRDLALGVLVAVLFIVVGNTISYLDGHNVVTQFQTDIYRTTQGTGWFLLLLFAVVVVTPIGEETLFRGFLFRGWNRSSRDAWFAITVTALLWAVIHVQYDLYIIGQVFVCGLIFGWFRWMSGSTILTMLMHGLVNFEGMIETFASLHSQVKI